MWHSCVLLRPVSMWSLISAVLVHIYIYEVCAPLIFLRIGDKESPCQPPWDCVWRVGANTCKWETLRSILARSLNLHVTKWNALTCWCTFRWARRRASEGFRAGLLWRNGYKRRLEVRGVSSKIRRRKERKQNQSTYRFFLIVIGLLAKVGLHQLYSMVSEITRVMWEP